MIRGHAMINTKQFFGILYNTAYKNTSLKMATICCRNL